MTAEFLTMLWHSVVASSLAILVVLAIRVPLRRVFGCGAAYGAWLAVPLCAAAAIAPRPAELAWTVRVVPASLSAVKVAPMTGVASQPLWPSLIVVAWGLGFIVALAWQIRLQRRFVRALGPLHVTGDIAVSHSLVAGPSLVGLWRPVIAVPSDFAQRFTPHERELVIAHERAHARHGDALVNAVCAALRCIWWFNPLAHFAARVVRVDQELTRDAEVMRAHPHSRHAYASALLKAQLVATDPPIASHWRSRHPLKERVMSLTRKTPTVARRLGTVVVSMAMLGGTYAAWAAQSASDVDPGRNEHARWANARPSTVIKLESASKPGRFLVSAVITDLVTGDVLARPRLLTATGTPATIETGSEQTGFRLVVTVNPSGRAAAYTSEVLRNGRVESSQSGTVVLTVAGPGVPSGPTEPDAGVDASPRLSSLSFSSSDAGELACAGDVFAARGEPALAGAMRMPADGQVHVASTTKPITNEANGLIAALAKCQFGADSNLAWKAVRP